MKYHVYILYSESFDRFYIGQTDDLLTRLEKHNAGEVKSTKHYIPWQLKYAEHFTTRGAAMKREKFLKRQKNKAFYWRLINAQWAESRDLGINH